jgi:hypothetical protein
VCPDCEGHMRLPGKGVGSGKRRFDIKIYAANGLMRSGAWAAAWREMERVDVEIDVWMPEDLRRALDQEFQNEEDEEIKRREREESILQRADAEIEALSRANEDALAAREEAERARLRAVERAEYMQREVNRLLAASVDSTPTPMPELTFASTTKALTNSRHSSSVDSRRRSSTSQHDATLATLVRKALLLASRDPRNIALFGLSILVFLLALGLGRSPSGVPSSSSADTMTQLQRSHSASHSDTSTSSLSIATSISTVTDTVFITTTSSSQALHPSAPIQDIEAAPDGSSSAQAVPDPSQIVAITLP